MQTERCATMSVARRLCFFLLALVGGSGIAFAQTTIFQYDPTGRIRQVTDTSSDVNNCGAVGNVCSAGSACCWGVCANVTGDVRHCGSCANDCHMSATGTCGGTPLSCNGTCAAGYANCDGSLSNGCETDITTVSNCGACGVACSTNHVVPICVAGSCSGGICAPGYADCNGNKQSDGCESQLAADVNNCGGCGLACSANHITRACVGGSCESGTCAAGYGDCNGNKRIDGCELNLMSDPNNCGSCGHVCSSVLHASSIYCSNGTCGFKCASGYYDCGGGCCKVETCFVAGTPVMLADGSEKPIEFVAVGDEVMAYEPETAEFSVGVVQARYVHPDTPTLLRINGTLTTTPEHRFFVRGKWVRADELRLGDELLVVRSAMAGRGMPSASPVVEQLELLPGGVETYNIEITPLHNYFAGGVLVHNIKQ